MSASIPEGSLWRSRRQYGLGLLRYDEKTSVYVEERTDRDNIVDIQNGDYVQFLEYKFARVRNTVLNRAMNEHVISLLLVNKGMQKAVINVRTSQAYWEAWWLETFESVSK